MSIVAPIQEIRRLISDAVDDIPHPSKDREEMGLQRGRHGTEPMRYGRIVFIEGGAVAVLISGDYLVARGETHDDSLRQLAYMLKVSPLDLGVRVDVLTADEFRNLLAG